MLVEEGKEEKVEVETTEADEPEPKGPARLVLILELVGPESDETVVVVPALPFWADSVVVVLVFMPPEEEDPGFLPGRFGPPEPGLLPGG